MSNALLIGLFATGAAVGIAGALAVMRCRLSGWRRIAAVGGTFVLGLVFPFAVALGVVAYQNAADPAPNVFLQPGPANSGTR